MEKEKIIEELEAILEQEQIKIANTVEEFAKLQKVGITRCNAEALYNANCRIVPEWSVVFTKEELDSKHIFDDEMFLKVLDAERGLGRKEAAREILEKVGNIEDCGGIPLKQYQWFVDLCKKYGVEVQG